MIKPLLGALAGFGLILSAGTATAQSCAARAAIVDRLQQKYSERLAAGGLQPLSDGASVIELWASSETGTFTVLLTRATGISCIVAAGTDYFQTSDTQTVPDIPS
ncbi:hypothetical protein MB818_10645 [Ruegeria sp. 1NDH52C]|uniref:Lipoprotein n=1 Tax=Ruegeria alba TaxID=2916756 RepID=A0ABS9NY64_9RHOB|nr:hypothetical protein [Ruegeria alba]MCG6558662.1 hypothetical protein [Ruegeria alba]